MVLISGVFYKHLTNDVDVVVGRPPCQRFNTKLDKNEILSIKKMEIHLHENTLKED